jgi:hypothetical protein
LIIDCAVRNAIGFASVVDRAGVNRPFGAGQVFKGNVGNAVLADG